MRICFILLLNLLPIMAQAFSVTELEALRLKFGAPGAGASIIKPQSTAVWTSGLRKVGSSARIQNSDKFHLGSNTKAMTATLLAQRIEAGELRWDSTLKELFPELAIRSEFVNVTLEMLAAHRSGISGNMTLIENGQLWSWMWQNNSAQELSQRYTIAQRILAYPAEQSPGAAYIYSNWNYIIIGAVLEKLSGKSWETLMRENIFNPLKMSSCGFGIAANSQLASPDQPWSHTLQNGVLTPLLEDNPQSFGPAGTVYCSLNDWGQFLRAHIQGFQRKDTPILRGDGFQKLHTPYPGQEYTPGGWLSFTFQNRPVLQHTGSNTLNFAHVWLFPAQELGFTAVTNADGAPSLFSFTDAVVAELFKSAF